MVSTSSTGVADATDDLVRLVGLRDTPLDVGEVLDVLGHDSGGGVTFFVGRVRDHDGGQEVTGLDYSAHPSALEQMRTLCTEVAHRHDVLAVAAVHRLGRLEIGDAAVVVAAVAAHRGEAFAATKDLIDTLKAQVPIWKHQVFADGTEEWVGTP